MRGGERQGWEGWDGIDWGGEGWRSLTSHEDEATRNPRVSLVQLAKVDGAGDLTVAVFSYHTYFFSLMNQIFKPYGQIDDRLLTL